MKKPTTVISVAIAVILLITAFSGCSPKIIQGTFELTPSENLIYASNSENLSFAKRYGSYEEWEKIAIELGQTLLRFEVVGESFNTFENDYMDTEILSRCATLTPVKIKEIYHLGKDSTLKVGDVIYLSLKYIYVDEDVRNACYSAIHHGEKSTAGQIKVGNYIHWGGDPQRTNFVFLKIGEEYFASVSLGYLRRRNNEETWDSSYVCDFEKDGIKFQFYQEVTDAGPIPLTEEINRENYMPYYLTLYDGFIEKYGNKEVLS